ncbi:MAG: hypothetical protein PHO58_05805 [Bacilli bacterium]|nr:hypothetical protein [Bacilli bacterium]
MFKYLNRKLTKNHTEVPLFWVEFNLNKYNEFGVKDSCTVKIHPDLSNDVYIQCAINDIIDYIRNHWDMEKLSK